MNPRPAVRKVMDYIRAEISSGAMAAGEVIPGVEDLARRLRVSAGTIYPALRELKREGVLKGVPGA